MSVPLRAAFAWFMALTACDAELDRLERELLSARTHLGELERAERTPPGELEAIERDVDHRLPDSPRGALTASIAAFLAQFPGAEVDAALEPVTIGHVLTDPLELTLPRDLKTARAVFDFMKRRDALWQLDSITVEDRWLRMKLHGYNFAGSSTLRKLELEVTADEETIFSSERDRVRQELRVALAEIDAQAKKQAADPLSYRRRKAGLKRALLADLSDRMAKIENDAELLLDVFAETAVLPREMTIGIRMGRRICSIWFDSEAEKKRVIAVGAAKPKVALDAKERELVLPTGRVCNLKVLPPS